MFTFSILRRGNDRSTARRPQGRRREQRRTVVGLENLESRLALSSVAAGVGLDTADLCPQPLPTGNFLLKR